MVWYVASSFNRRQHSTDPAMESPHRSPAPVAAHYIPYEPGDDRVYKRESCSAQRHGMTQTDEWAGRYNVIKQLVYKLEDVRDTRCARNAL